MSRHTINTICEAIRAHRSNAWARKLGYEPLFTGTTSSKIVLIGQAPGIRAQQSGIPWDDKSGERLRTWLGMSEETFYDSQNISLMPMDFYYPGKGKTGDLPPRKDFAELWHKQLLAAMPDIQLCVLIGQYAQAFYLGDRRKRTLTETVKNYENYLPQYFPLPHPSPRNNIWMKKNSWFEKDVIPHLQKAVKKVLKK